MNTAMSAKEGLPGLLKLFGKATVLNTKSCQLYVLSEFYTGLFAQLIRSGSLKVITR
jgi:hypothetical protein